MGSRQEILKMDKSDCCNAKVKVGGEHSTHFYICTKCGNPCDVKKEAK
jgi:hypothetical protein